MSAYLDGVTKAKQKYVAAKVTLEQRLRESLKDELHSMKTQVDIAVRYAADNGHSKAEILRALGTKDYHTVYGALKRTEGVAEIMGINPLDSVYSYYRETEMVHVKYLNHGPQLINGSATFKFRNFDDGMKLFLSEDKLWNEDYTVRNEVVAVLDQVEQGFYYDEAVEWIAGQTNRDAGF